MKVFVDNKKFPYEVKSVTYKKHYNGAFPKGWDFYIHYEVDGTETTLPMAVINFFRNENRDNYYLITPEGLEWLLTNEEKIKRKIKLQ